MPKSRKPVRGLSAKSQAPASPLSADPAGNGAAPVPILAAGPEAGRPAAEGEPQKQKESRRRLIWLFCMLLLAVGIYRLATFTPQPLDSPHTLRPLLYRWYSALFRPDPYTEKDAEAWTGWCYLALAIPAVLALLSHYSARGIFPLRGRAGRIVGSRALLFGSIAVGLFVCRFPVLLRNHFNPDESQFLAAADKLFIDPVFFRSVDCGSSGPGNIYPLMLPALAGISPDYVSSRLVGLLLILLSIYFLYRGFAVLGADDVARIAILPAFGFFALAAHPDFVHYSSEHVPLLLCSLAFFAAIHAIRRPESGARPLIGLGALTAAAFFTKMLSVPIIAAAAAVAASSVYLNGASRWPWRPILLLFAGFAPLPLINACVCAAAGVWRDFWTAYVLGNWQYAQAKASTTFLSEFPQFASYLVLTREFQFLILTFLALLAVSVYQTMRREPRGESALFIEIATVITGVLAAAVYVKSAEAARPQSGLYALCFLGAGVAAVFLAATARWEDRAIRWFGLLSAAMLAAALFSVYAARRMFPHYELLLVIPLCMAMAWILIRRPDTRAAGLLERRAPPPALRPRLSFVLLFLALSAGSAKYLVPGLLYNVYPPPPPTLANPGSELIQKLTRPRSRIVVWGWNSEVYLGAGRSPATRDISGAGTFMLAGARIGSFGRERFLRDLRRRPADLFIDALDTSCCYFDDRNKYGFDLLPEIKSYIYGRYIQVSDADSERFYMRRDLVGIGNPKPCAADAIRCYESTRGSREPLPPVRMPEHALIEAEIKPLLKQELFATIFRSEAPPDAPEGFQLQNIGADTYRFSVGLGDRWISREMDLPAGKSVSLAIELQGNTMTIFLNGEQRDRAELPHRMADASGPILLGSSMGGRHFLGAINSFQIRDLGRGASAVR